MENSKPNTIYELNVGGFYNEIPVGSSVIFNSDNNKPKVKNLFANSGN